MISETYCFAKHKIHAFNFAHMNTISSHLHRFSNKRPPWMGGGGRLLEGGAN